MGFKVNQTTLKLVFDDPELEGLVVRMRAGTVGQRMQLNELNTNDEIIEFYAGLLVEWNAEDDDGPLPMTADGVTRLDHPTFLAIQRAWTNVRQTIPAPLEQQSNAGATSLEESMPMDDLSASLAS
ncbi:hypothetical protein [Amycolatopsis sp. DSM 110486]|uniref:hypothetical protein n=1 Tax=Amycolatopsis sp. DSM 110486 TaxID=2865832 RepID=UPI001C696FA7|nr:hypothetical protein [Amycolatopsis sp. DSM 110486]QYN26684.1 hypothetical protein K1T34_52875 [Amycolatopsis sp. DSM 110486]